MSKKIIVPIDDSIHSHHALQFAVKIAKEMDGEIVIVNIQPNLFTPNIQRFISKGEIHQYLQQMAEEILEKASEVIRGEDVQVEKIVRIGIPKVEITKLAKELDAFQIVMGSRGMGPVKSAVLGSVSIGVLQLTPCPVTIVP
jgi:nucleotide-binding universal stress UspA family protein